MATTYVDTSALVKRYVAEVGSAWVRRTVARPVHQVLYTAALTEVEVRSALQRLVREGRLDTAQAQRLSHRVTRHFTRRYQVIRITRTVVTQAGMVLERHPLRAYDCGTPETRGGRPTRSAWEWPQLDTAVAVIEPDFPHLSPHAPAPPPAR